MRLKASFPTPRDAVASIMDTFPIVRRKDEAQFDGDYRTRRVILEIGGVLNVEIRRAVKPTSPCFNVGNMLWLSRYLHF